MSDVHVELGYQPSANPDEDYGQRSLADKEAMARAVQGGAEEAVAVPERGRVEQGSLFDEGVAAAVRESAVRVVDAKAEAVASAQAIARRTKPFRSLTHAEAVREGVIERRRTSNP